MFLARWQRWSGAIFLVAVLVQAHLLGPSTASWAVKGVLAVLLASGIAHAAAGLYVIATDLRGSALARRIAGGATLVLCAVSATAAGLASSREGAPPPIPGHVDGARCGACHAELEQSRDPLHGGVHDGVACKSCHRGDAAATARACGRCHLQDGDPHAPVTSLDSTRSDSLHGAHTMTCATCHESRKNTWNSEAAPP